MKFDELAESTVIPEHVTVEEILKMHDAARRAISILNKIKDPAQRKRHASQVFKNLNRIKAMLMKLTEPEKD